jgi:hypothetical protein
MNGHSPDLNPGNMNVPANGDFKDSCAYIKIVTPWMKMLVIAYIFHRVLLLSTFFLTIQYIYHL